MLKYGREEFQIALVFFSATIPVLIFDLKISLSTILPFSQRKEEEKKAKPVCSVRTSLNDSVHMEALLVGPDSQ